MLPIHNKKTGLLKPNGSGLGSARLSV